MKEIYKNSNNLLALQSNGPDKIGHKPLTLSITKHRPHVNDLIHVEQSSLSA